MSDVPNHVCKISVVPIDHVSDAFSGCSHFTHINFFCMHDCHMSFLEQCE